MNITRKMRRDAEGVQRHHESSADLRRYAVAISPRGHINVAFSMGKDALAAFLALREEPGVELSLHHTYLVPGLSFVEEWIAYYERKLGLKIHQLPHYSLPRWLENEVFQPPSRGPLLRGLRFREYSQAEMHEAALEMAGAPPDALIATGVRAADSPKRQTTCRVNGTLNPHALTFFAVYDWGIADVEQAIARSGLRLPVDYLLFGRTFDGLVFRFLAKIKERFPADYAKICEYFPLVDVEIFRRGLACPRAS